jgi:hypothetical protein
LANPLATTWSAPASWQCPPQKVDMKNPFMNAKPIHEWPDPFMNGKSYSEWDRPIHECKNLFRMTPPLFRMEKTIQNAKTYSE